MFQELILDIYLKYNIVTKAPMLWEQGVAGSNPATSTSNDDNKSPPKKRGFLLSVNLFKSNHK